MAEDFIELTDALTEDLAELKFVDPVAYVYNPLEYAREPHEDFVRKFCNSTKEVLLMGMNPGPFGMAQNGVSYFSKFADLEQKKFKKKKKKKLCFIKYLCLLHLLQSKHNF